MFKLIFSPFGAIHRKSYLYGCVAVMLFLTVCLIAWAILISQFASYFSLPPESVNAAMWEIARALREDNPLPNFSGAFALVYVSFGVFIICALWSKLCLGIKRLRDLAVSPWLIVIPFAITFVLRSPNTVMPTLSITLAVLLILINLMFLFYPSRINK